MNTHIKSYHAYITKWTLKNEEILKAPPEPENEYDKYAVAVENCGDVVGQLSKGRSARFAETVSLFLRASNKNCCRSQVTDQKVNLGVFGERTKKKNVQLSENFELSEFELSSIKIRVS